MNIRSYTTTKQRREALEKELSVHLHSIGSSSVDDHTASAKNCENMIGYAQIPIGIAGPLDVTAPSYGTKKNFYLPLSTTEGALIASISRGCKAVSSSGGAYASSIRAGTTRGVTFSVSGIAQGKIFSEYISAHTTTFATIAAQTSSHISLMDVVVKSVGKLVFVRFSFNTQDAMGMNMVTIAADAIATHITSETQAKCVSVAGNYDIDKKPAWLNAIRGRGFESRADVTLTSQVISEVLKTTAQSMYDVWISKCMIGSSLSGSMGFNAQYANVIAALFLATGQDMAHVGEGSIGITTCEVVSEGLYVSVYLPDLMVGTVGGGTGLATQKESLRLLEAGLTGDTLTSQIFSEVIAAAVLTGEISLLASLSEGSLTRAHKRLGRGEHV